MKTLTNFIYERAKKFVPKIPKNIYFDKVATASELIKKFNDDFGISKDMLKTLFTGLESAKFKVLISGGYGGCEDADDAIDKIFPGDDSYWGYLEEADLWEDLEDNGCIAKFIANNNKAICIADTGDDGRVYVCVEQ